MDLENKYFVVIADGMKHIIFEEECNPDFSLRRWLFPMTLITMPNNAVGVSPLCLFGDNKFVQPFPYLVKYKPDNRFIEICQQTIIKIKAKNAGIQIMSKPLPKSLVDPMRRGK